MTAIGATLLSGCASNKSVKNSEELLTEMQKASTSYDSAEMGFNMSITAEGDAATGGSFSMVMDGVSSVIVKSETVKMEGTMKFNLAGQEQESDMKVYSQKGEDGKYTVYTYEETAGWYKTTSETSDYDYSSMVDIKGMKEFASALELSKETETVDKVKCYKMSGTLTGENLKAIYSGYESMGITDDTLDDYSVDLTILAEKDTFRTKAMKLTLKSKEGAEVPMECTIDITFKSFDSVDSIEIPAEAKEAQDMTTTN